MDLAIIEKIFAIVGGIIVFLVAVIAFWNDRKSVGIDNHVFKLMLVLLAVGAALAFFAAVGLLGNFPKAA